MKTRITARELFAIDLPILQSPMAGAQDAALTLAVSEAGGLGGLPCAMLSAEVLQKQLAWLTARTSKPYNLNFFCHTPPTVDDQKEVAWRASLAAYFREFNIDPLQIPQGPQRQPFNHDVADLVEPFQPPVVSFHFGLPEAELLDRVNGWGALVMASATTVEEARWLEANGADVIIAQGVEAGGHRGMFLDDDINTQVGTFALLPQIVRAVQLPVVAAGGIADGAGIAAALQLGAVAAQLGTAFLLCDESRISALHQAALQEPAAQVTALTNLFSGRPARGIVNRLMREQGPMSRRVPQFPLAGTAITALRKAAEQQGSSDFSPLWAGQNVTGCRKVAAAELVRELAQQLSELTPG
ncbi:NAD(P)H-dependent flavin oxidoreductase [Alcanivorax sp. 1008]|uniref:NAD(P)H-dependent flavin oxidoreductase n=1 Tax=Alcanivorax sp. 1008 TaxID=2816853 RepID=UPI00351DA8DD